MLKILLLTILATAVIPFILRKRKRQVTTMTDSLLTEEDQIRLVFLKLHPAGKSVICTSGDPRYKMLVQDALWKARDIRVDIDLDIFKQRLQELAVPENVIEEFVSTLRVMDDTCLQLENS